MYNYFWGVSSVSWGEIKVVYRNFLYITEEKPGFPRSIHHLEGRVSELWFKSVLLHDSSHSIFIPDHVLSEFLRYF